MRRLTPLCLVVAVVVSCATTTPAPTASISPIPSASPRPSALTGLAEKPITIVNGNRRWITVADGLNAERPVILAEFPEVDATPGQPRARLRATGRTVELERHTPTVTVPVKPVDQWTAAIPVDGAPTGTNTIDVLVRLRDGSDVVVGSWSFLLSMPEYVVWTLDFEGDAASDDALAKTWDIAGTVYVPMTIMWNSRVWTTSQVTAERADAMTAWTQDKVRRGVAEVGLHVHAWTDFVRDAGVTPRTAPNWSGRSDGYDVPLTAFDESETRKLIDHAVELMTQHGFAKPTVFRAGGLFANAANLRAITAAGFTVDSSAAAAGGFGRLPLPWTLPKDAQPYHPSRDDANATGDLPLLEAPNIAGNTYALTVSTIQPTIRDDLAMLAPAGQPATARRALTLVSHPATIDATERAAIQALFDALAPLRYDRDAGPLRFVTLSQLAKAYAN